MAEEPQHWPTERMINEGHADYATTADLEALDDALLADVASICGVVTFAPDECIPCQAHVMYLERMRLAAAESLAPDPEAESEPDDQNLVDWGEEAEYERERAESEYPEGIPVDIRRKAPVEVLQFQMELMRNTLDEIVNGPPIPPKEVSLDELALLTVAAQKWIAIMEAQGVELSGSQQVVFDTTKALVARLHND